MAYMRACILCACTCTYHVVWFMCMHGVCVCMCVCVCVCVCGLYVNCDTCISVLCVHPSFMTS